MDTSQLLADIDLTFAAGVPPTALYYNKIAFAYAATQDGAKFDPRV